VDLAAGAASHRDDDGLALGIERDNPAHVTVRQLNECGSENPSFVERHKRRSGGRRRRTFSLWELPQDGQDRGRRLMEFLGSERRQRRPLPIRFRRADSRYRLESGRRLSLPGTLDDQVAFPTGFATSGLDKVTGRGWRGG
jgi:hypothetical protein